MCTNSGTRFVQAVVKDLYKQWYKIYTTSGTRSIQAVVQDLYKQWYKSGTSSGIRVTACCENS